MEEENIDERIQKGIRSLGLKKKDKAIWYQEYAFRKDRSHRNSIYWIGGAASVAIIGTVVLSYYNSIDTEIKDSGSPQFSYEVQSSSKSVVQPTIEEEVKALIEKKEYELALETIESYLQDSVAFCSQQTKQFPIEKERESQIDELEWMKIQCLIGLSQVTEAEDLLKKYISHNNGIHLEEAQKLLDVLNR